MPASQSKLQCVDLHKRLLRETALGRRAAEIHALIDDETCWRWCCILAAYAEQQGWLTPHRTNALAAEPYFCKSRSSVGYFIGIRNRLYREAGIPIPSPKPR